MNDPDNCPICGDGVRNVKNHVRMKNGGEHGPAQEYPAGFDPDTLEYDEGAGGEEARGASGSSPRGATSHPADEPEAPGDHGGGNSRSSDLDLDRGDGDHGDRGDDPVPLEITDRPSDQRQYQCPNCEETVEYLDDECSNEHGQRWVMSA